MGIAWNKRYETGIAGVDQQHRKLVSLVSDLGDAMQQGQGAAVIDDIVDQLVAYTRTHFSLEESLMAKAGYGGLAEHKKIHKAFVDKIGAIGKEDTKRTTVTIDLYDFLFHWLLEHIQGEDKKYVDAVRRAGL